MRTAILWVATLLFATTAAAETVNPAQQRETAEKFGVEITRAFNARDKETLKAMFDFHALTQRSAEFLGYTGKEAQDFVKGAESTGMDRMIDSYLSTLEAGNGTVKFMRVTDSRPPRALVRLEMGDKGFNYLEFVLRTDAKGRTRTIDWFQLSSGELMSVTLATASQMAMANNPGLLQRVFGGVGKIDNAAVEKVRKIGELQRAGKYAEALAMHKQLPEPLLSSRLMLSARAMAASLANLPEEYDRALELMAEKYSDDPAASFMLIDYYFTRKDSKQVLKALDTMERRVGVDAATCMLRANTYVMDKDFTNALKHADQAIRLEPENLAGYDTRATLLVQSGQYQEAVDAYRDMEKRFELKFTRDVFLKDATFKPLVASKPFRTWLPK